MTSTLTMNGSDKNGAFPSELFESEVEVSPGIFLIKRKTQSPPAAIAAQLPHVSGTGSVAGGVMHGIVTQTDNLEFLAQEADRLKHSVELLLKTNAELREYSSTDPDCAEASMNGLDSCAIQENVTVIDRQMRMIKAINNRSQQLMDMLESADSKATPQSCFTSTLGQSSTGPQLTPENMMDEQLDATVQDDDEGVYL
ncbi:hypothetical protein BDEG_26194 [Batrachochytrium dendrobatidis JEL423]|uniref:Uncharacterized protein n=1 Tax=Batrachochytrium dendrobatidis (strain JEL423) TaxID=403673 RepID=A0A177WSB5_BATDL|nr:hypothetical protein BDEG_26194 [Batrachochytrium dendrobatidis JEL423]